MSTRALREGTTYRTLTAVGSCSTTELLVTLLGTTEAKALEVLEHAGGWPALARAQHVDLADRLGDVSCARILAAGELGRRMLVPDVAVRQINSPADAFAIIGPLCMHKDQEYLYVLLLNTRNHVLGEPIEVYHGSLNTSLIRVGEIYKPAVKANAAAVVVAHNHPSGDPSPSPEDIAVTRAIVEAGKLLDIEMLDHLVIGSNRFVSLKERGFVIKA